MNADLQGLLERIQHEGVEKADAEARRIVDEASRRAAAMIADAERHGAELQARSERETAAAAERARRSISQAGRDVVLSVRGAVEQAALALVRRETARAMDPATLSAMIASMAAAYSDAIAAGKRLEVLIAPEQQRAVADHIATRLAAELRKGVDLVPEAGITAGFRVQVDGGRVVHDLTDAAITEALGRLVREDIGQTLRQAESAA